MGRSKIWKLTEEKFSKIQVSKKGTRILDILKALVHLRFWRLKYENNIFTAKKTH